MFKTLPARLGNTRDLAFGRELAEANAAETKLAHVGALPTAAPAPANDTGRKLRLRERTS